MWEPWNGLFLPLALQGSQSGFGDLRDLLSPQALFNFSAVTRTKDPPSEESKRAFSPPTFVAEVWPSKAPSCNSASTNCVETPPTGMERLKASGRVYFCYLFLFSGLEFTLSFLTHQRFHFTRLRHRRIDGLMD